MHYGKRPEEGSLVGSYGASQNVPEQHTNLLLFPMGVTKYFIVIFVRYFECCVRVQFLFNYI